MRLFCFTMVLTVCSWLWLLSRAEVNLKLCKLYLGLVDAVQNGCYFSSCCIWKIRCIQTRICWFFCTFLTRPDLRTQKLPTYQVLCFSQLLKTQCAGGSRRIYIHISTRSPLVNVHKSHINWLDSSHRWCCPKSGPLQPAFGAQQLVLVLKFCWRFTKAPNCNTVLHMGRRNSSDRSFLLLFQSNWRKRKWDLLQLSL